MEQLVLLLIIGAISLINWLIEQSGKRREKRRLEKEVADQESEESSYRQPSAAPVAPAPESARGAEMRRFLESFGIPLPEENEVAVVEREVPATTPVPATPVRIPIVEAKPSPVIAKKPPTASSLKSAAALRQAIVWREILGPPRSLQPF